MLSSAVKKYADYYGVATGQKNIFFTNNDTAYESAISLKKKELKLKQSSILENNLILHLLKKLKI